MDNAIIIAVLGLAGTVIVALIGMVVNLATNKTRIRTAAEEAAVAIAEKAQEDKEQSLRERIVLRDERIEGLTAELARVKEQRDTLLRQAAGIEEGSKK